MKQEQLDDLRQRMIHHSVVADTAVVVVSAAELSQLLDMATATPWEDAPLPEDTEINAAHPLRTGQHKMHAEARRLVSARHSKGALINLVNWLLSRIELGNLDK